MTEVIYCTEEIEYGNEKYTNAFNMVMELNNNYN